MTTVRLVVVLILSLTLSTRGVELGGIERVGSCGAAQQLPVYSVDHFFDPLSAAFNDAGWFAATCEAKEYWGPNCYEFGRSGITMWVLDTDLNFARRVSPDICGASYSNHGEPTVWPLSGGRWATAHMKTSTGYKTRTAVINPEGLSVSRPGNNDNGVANCANYDGAQLANGDSVIVCSQGGVPWAMGVSAILEENVVPFVACGTECTSGTDHVRVAPTTDGGFVVVWNQASHPDDVSGQAVLIRKYSASFTPDTPAMLLSTVTAGTQKTPDVAVDPASGVIIAVWSSDNMDTSGAALVGRAFTPSLVRIGPHDTVLNAEHFGEQRRPVPTMLNDGILYVGFQTVADYTSRKFWVDTTGDLPLGFIPLTGDVPMSTSGTFSADTTAGHSARNSAPGSYNAAAATFYFVNLQEAFVISCQADRNPITLDATACTTLGHPVFSMACLQAAIDALHPITELDRVIELDPSSVWTGCLPGNGVLVDKAVILRSSVPNTPVRIDCAHTGRAFTLDGSLMANALSRARSVSFVDFEITNGLAPTVGAVANSGGAIAVLNTLDGPVSFFSRVTIASSSAPNGDGGGMAFVDAPGVHLNNVNISDCSAGTGNGGALSYLVSDETTVSTISLFGIFASNVSLSRCSATNGGAVYGTLGGALYPPSFFTDVMVLHNEATESGGGMHLSSFRGVDLGPRLTVSSNVARGSQGGGGIAFVDAVGSVVLDHALLENNSATGGPGGGILHTRVGTNLAGTLSIQSSSITSCSSAKEGGGVYVFELSLSMGSGSFISLCTARTRGGAVAVSSNAVDQARPVIALGGALGPVTFSSNTVLQGGGGGVYALGGALKLGYGLVIQGGSVAPGTGGSALFLTGKADVEFEGDATRGRVDLQGDVFACLRSVSCGQTVCSSEITIESMLGNAAASMSGAVPVGTNTSVTLSGRLSTDSVALQLVGTMVEKTETGDRVFLPGSGGGIRGLDALGGTSLPGALVILSLGDAGSSSQTCTLDESGFCSLGSMRAFARVEEDIGNSFVLDARMADAPCVELSQSTPVGSRTVTIVGCQASNDKLVAESNSVVCVVECGQAEYLFTQVENGEVLDAQCLPCPAGTAQDRAGHAFSTCEPCPAGHYSFEGESFCRPCPEGANCGSRGDRLEALPGYWFVSAGNRTHVPLFYKCEPAEACVGGARHDACRTPAYNDDSFLCSKCGNGYARIGRTCEKCWPAWASWIVVVLIGSSAVATLAVVIILGSAAARSQTRGESRTGRDGGGATVAVKIAVSYLQILSLASTFKAQTSDLIRNIGALVAGFTSPSFSFHTFACLFGTLSPLKEFALTMTLPAMVTVGVLATFGVSLLLTRDKETRARRARLGFQTLCILLFLVYPVILRSCASMYHCVDYEGISGSRLISDLDIVCYRDDHLVAAVFAMLFALLYVIGIPVLALMVMIHDRRAMNASEFAAKWTFLIAGYKPELWWYELVVIVRKAVVVVLVVFVEDATMQAAIGATLLAMAMAVHLELLPYTQTIFDKVECLALAALSVTLVGAISLVDTAEDVTQAQATSVVVVVILLNALLFVALGWVAFRRTGSSADGRDEVEEKTRAVVLATALSPFGSDDDESTSSYGSL